MLLSADTAVQKERKPVLIYILQCRVFLTTVLMSHHVGLLTLFRLQRQEHERIQRQYELLSPSDRIVLRGQAARIGFSKSLERMRGDITGHFGDASARNDVNDDQQLFLSELQEMLYSGRFAPLPKLFSDRAVKMKQRAEILSADHPLVIGARLFADQCFIATAASACCTDQWSIFFETIDELVGRASQLGQRGQAGDLLGEAFEVIKKQCERYPDYPWEAWLEKIGELDK
jgi:hypothetical protein